MSSAPESGAVTLRQDRPDASLGALARLLGGWTMVMLATVLVLGLLDAVPGHLSGKPRGVMSVGTIDEAERQLGTRLRLPSYFPDSLRWPPAAVEVYPGPPPAAALRYEGPSRSDLQLIVCQTLEPSESIPVKLLPPGLILESARTIVRTRPATLMRVQLDDGRLVHELSWDDAGRMMAMRFDGSVEQLMMVARSVSTDRR